MVEFKPGFVERYGKLTDIDEFMKYSVKPLRKAIRVNTLKNSVYELKNRLSEYRLTKIPWCKEGFYITGPRTDLGNLKEHILGYFYVQDAASMIPPLILDPKQGLVLDMAASPGSKTTQISAMMKNKGIIIANDVENKRIKALSTNLQRCGVSNAIITKMHAQGFKNLECDYILLDAPCSGSGIIRKSLGTLKIWNPKMVKKLAGIQKQLIMTAYDCLNPEGSLVYSTCSVDPEENEGVVSHLLENSDAKVDKIELNIKRSEPVVEFEDVKYNSEIKKCLRIWPQDNDSEGFFVSRISKG